MGVVKGLKAYLAFSVCFICLMARPVGMGMVAIGVPCRCDMHCGRVSGRLVVDCF